MLQPADVTVFGPPYRMRGWSAGRPETWMRRTCVPCQVQWYGAPGSRCWACDGVRGTRQQQLEEAQAVSSRVSTLTGAIAGFRRHMRETGIQLE